jgi:O-antigen ligase
MFSKAVWPFYLFGILVSSIIVSWQVLDISLVPRFLCLAVFLLLLVPVLFHQLKNRSLQITPIWLVYGGYVLIACMSLAWCHNISENLFENYKLVLGFTVCAISAYLYQTDSQRFLSGLSTVSVIIVSVLIIISVRQLLQLPELNNDTRYAITGLNGHKNLLSSFLFLNLPFLTWGIVKKKGLVRLCYSAVMIGALLLLIILRTKAVFLGVAGMLLFIVAISSFSKRQSRSKFTIRWGYQLIAFLAAALVFFIWVLPISIKPVVERNKEIILQKDRARAELDQERLLLWKKTYTLIERHPIVGVGSGNWQIFFPDAGLNDIYRAEDLNFTFQRPHNDFLWIFSELGIVGFLMYMLLIGLIFLAIFKAISDKGLSFKQRLLSPTVLLGGVLTGYCIISFFDFPKERIEHSLFLNIVLALIIVETQKNTGLTVLFRLKCNAPVKWVLILVFGFGVFLGYKRFVGEWHTRKLYDARQIKQPLRVLQEAQKAFSWAYSIDPTSIPLHWYMGNACVDLGNPQQALPYFEKAYAYNPYNRNVLNDLASANSVMGNVREAIEIYNEALRISPRFDEPKLNLVALLIREANYKEADAYLQTLCHDSPRRTEYQTIVNAMLRGNPSKGPN